MEARLVEEAEGNFSAYSPDLPGCVATGATVDETIQNMIPAISFHLEDCEGTDNPTAQSRAIFFQPVHAWKFDPPLEKPPISSSVRAFCCQPDASGL